MCLFLRKNHLLRCWDWVSLLNWIGALTLSLLLKLPPRKLEPFLWTSMKFLSPEVAVYLYKSTIHPYIEYCCHVWAGAPSCYLELLDRLRKQICRAIVSSFAACLEPLAHRRNRASLSLLYRYYFGRCSWKLAQLVPLFFFQGRFSRYFDRLLDFYVTIPRCYKDIYLNSFFPYTAILLSSLSIECFPLT